VRPDLFFLIDTAEASKTIHASSMFPSRPVFCRVVAGECRELEGEEGESKDGNGS
jgi:hypothetical protein